MKPLFTIHAGEYLVGSQIEAHYPKWNVWIPSKDTGIDLLVTNAATTKAVSLQVKFSKDFNPTHHPHFLRSKLKAGGWWTHQEKKIKGSTANFWVFVLPSFAEREISYIIIPPHVLLRRLKTIHTKGEKRIHSYFWVTKKSRTKKSRCWEGRGLKNSDKKRIASNSFHDKERDFTSFLNGWEQIEKWMK
jgi:hypothetical protein